MVLKKFKYDSQPQRLTSTGIMATAAESPARPVTFRNCKGKRNVVLFAKIHCTEKKTGRVTVVYEIQSCANR